MRMIVSPPAPAAPKRAALVFFHLVLTCAVLLASGTDAAAQRKRRSSVDYGRIEITTNPAGYPVLVDGQPSGETTATVRNLDLPPGRHTVEIQFPNNTRWVRDFDVRAGRRECINLNFRPREVTVTRPGVSPCPYTVQVSAPTTVQDGDLITFTSDVAYNGPGALNYMWTVSPAEARVTRGQGTPTITVDSTGLGRKRITAVLMVDDGSGDRNCRQAATAATSILPAPVAVAPVPRKFDEFPSVTFDDDKARLDNFAIELQNDPTARGYVIVYQGARVKSGTADRLGDRTRDYLVRTRGIDASRITVVNGGTRPRNYFELYVVPQGAEPPRATSR